MTTISAPRSPYHRPGALNTELYAWLFMRVSGVFLVVLVFGHLFVNLVAGEWANPFWQVWDLLMLWLAMIHGTNGLRTVINDYAERDQSRFWLKMLLYVAPVTTILLGTLVIFSFDPCPAGEPAELLSSFCRA